MVICKKAAVEKPPLLNYLSLFADFVVNFVMEFCDEFIKSNCAKVAFFSGTNGNFAFFHFFCANYEHIGNFFKLCFADLETDFFITGINFRSEAAAEKFFLDLFCIFVLVLGDGEDANLFRRKPGGKCAAVFLDKESDGSFVATEGGSVDDVGINRLVVRT